MGSWNNVVVETDCERNDIGAADYETYAEIGIDSYLCLCLCHRNDYASGAKCGDVYLGNGTADVRENDFGSDSSHVLDNTKVQLKQEVTKNINQNLFL